MATQTADPPKPAAREQVFDLFRRWGYLEAALDPLGQMPPQPHPELRLSGPAADQARRIYCGAIGAEFQHIPDPARRRWIEERMEVAGAAPSVDGPRLLERLLRADLFEQVLQARYLGTKRFSLEGVTALIPLLDEVLEGASARGAEQAVIGMSHRGRLNVMAHTVGNRVAEIFAGFEDVDPRSVLGGGDVKYHVGSTGTHLTASGRKLNIHLVSNPSHLEAVDPVVLGRTRAKQLRAGDPDGARFLPILLHGDGAFAGQGIWAETLNLAALDGFNVGGALHVIVNNLIGFTTNPAELHSSRFASDLAKRLPIPIFHVNAEEPEAVVRVARMALEYRYTFSSDVVVDLIGYRRHGHSEIDDPSITQPVLYRKIQEHPPLWQLYAEKIGTDATALAARVREELEAAQQQAKTIEKRPTLRRLPAYWDDYAGGKYEPSYEVDTGLRATELEKLAEGLTRYPQDFAIHPKVKRLLEQRRGMGAGKHPVDYGMAEALAFASLVTAGVPVRMSGQDTRRGTFNQRHAALIDTRSEQVHIPLAHLAPTQARFEIYNSELSEAAVLGYEYGYSRDYPETLVLWEAQFGDFANGAQVILDQFISAGEDKWGLLSGVVVLLP
ncbi:MAG TPA: thiamine pyrophosphate-dependent enzyme, partial [Terriglobales bacterium]|nr:thiamine pyrophosphate-dependent enzyme [Terriglobales bacterium]